LKGLSCLTNSRENTMSSTTTTSTTIQGLAPTTSSSTKSTKSTQSTKKVFAPAKPVVVSVAAVAAATVPTLEPKAANPIPEAIPEAKAANPIPEAIPEAKAANPIPEAIPDAKAANPIPDAKAANPIPDAKAANPIPDAKAANPIPETKAVSSDADDAAEEKEGFEMAPIHIPVPSTSISITFDACLAKLGETMKESYTLDEDGAPVDLSVEQMAEIQVTIDSVKDRAKEVFEPFFASLFSQVEAQKKQVLALTAQAARGVGAGAPDSGNAVVMDEDAEIPTAEWIIANRKSKSGKDLTGYNCFTMFYMAKNKSGFPPKGLWDQQNKATWNALAKEVNGGATVGASIATTNASSPSIPSGIDLPQTKGKGQKLTAYNMYTIDYMAKNPGGGFPPKGSWAKVPKTEVARYQAQADALKAQRA
jgi:hypothetical protein